MSLDALASLSFPCLVTLNERVNDAVVHTVYGKRGHGRSHYACDTHQCTPLDTLPGQHLNFDYMNLLLSKIYRKSVGNMFPCSPAAHSINSSSFSRSSPFDFILFFFIMIIIILITGDMRWEVNDKQSSSKERWGKKYEEKRTSFQYRR